MAQQVIRRTIGVSAALAVAFAMAFGVKALTARDQARPATPATQAIDEEYTKRILDNTPDKRILTELVDHMPVSATECRRR